MEIQPDVVLVHGAWADGSSWSGVIEQLQANGYRAIAPQFPLTTLADNVARLRQVLDLQDGPVIIAGHSYGGQIISALGRDTMNAAGLVYIAAFGMAEGESLGALLSQTPPLRGVAHLFTDRYGFCWIPQDDFVGHYAPDVGPLRARVLHAVQQPLSQSSYTDVMGVPAWQSLPCWYLVATEDEVIPPAMQRMFAARMRATTTELPVSHLVPVSRPQEVAELIISAAQACMLAGA